MSDLESSLIADVPRLSPDEQKFMRQVFDRVLVVGRRNYSPWQMRGDNRSMLGEAKEELLDAVVYLAMETAQVEAKRARVAAFIAAYNSDPDDEPTGQWNIGPTGNEAADIGQFYSLPASPDETHSAAPRADLQSGEAPFSCPDCSGGVEHRVGCIWTICVPPPADVEVA